MALHYPEQDPPATDAPMSEYRDSERFAEYLAKATSPLGCGLDAFEIQWMFRTGGPALVAEIERLRDLARRMVDEFEYSSDRSDGTLSQGRRDLLDEARATYQQRQPEK